MDAFANNQNKSYYLFDNFLDLNAKHDSVRNTDLSILFSSKSPKQDFSQTVIIPESERTFNHTFNPKHLTQSAKFEILIFILFIVALLVQSLILKIYFKYFKVLLQSLFYDFIAEKAVNENSIPQSRLLQWMELLSILSYSLSLSVIAKFFLEQESGTTIMILSIGALTILGYRFWIWLYHKMLAMTTNAVEFVSILHFKNALSINIGALLLIPLSFMSSYVNQNYQMFLIYLCSSLIGVSWLYRYFLSFSLFIKKRVSILYYILYLCALELPLVLVVIHTLRAN